MLRTLTHLLSCREVTRLVSQMQDTPAPLTQRIKLRLHLLVCHGCNRFVRQMRFLRSAMRTYRQ
jgi:hypothetical protein